jgi:hypothetical protein
VWLQFLLQRCSDSIRYVHYPTGGQDMIVGCVPLQELAKLRALGLPFDLITS